MTWYITVAIVIVVLILFILLIRKKKVDDTIRAYENVEDNRSAFRKLLDACCGHGKN